MRSTGRRRERVDRSVVQVAITRFAVLTFVALVLVASVTVYMSLHIARDEAVRDARNRTIGIARGIAAPLVNSDVRDGDPEAMRALDDALSNRMRDGTVSHMVVWDVDGTPLWGDTPEEVDHDDGLPVTLTAVEAAEGDAVDRGPEPLQHVGAGTDDLVEVYVRVLDAEGNPFVFEAYTPRGKIQADARILMRELLPLTLGSLLLLVAAIVPLSLTLARRIDRANAGRREILRRSLRAWQRERERLAQSLHDDVIQDLSAMGYALPVVLEALPDDQPAAAARAMGEQMTGVLIRSVRVLRGVLTDLAPSGLEDAELDAALHALAQRHREHGLGVEMSTDPDLGVGKAAGTLVYRIVREGLHNVAKHADATAATVRVARRDAVVDVTIDDNGRGPVQHDGEDGHVGLRLLEHFLTDVHGSLELVERPGGDGGARLRAVVPARLPELDDALRD